jgi:hypothetical protein
LFRTNRFFKFKLTLVGRYFGAGNTLVLFFMGKVRKFKILSISTQDIRKDFYNSDQMLQPAYISSLDTKFTLQKEKEDPKDKGEPNSFGNLSFKDIGGLEGNLALVQEIVDITFFSTYLLKHFHLKPPKGLLLFGPPGFLRKSDLIFRNW